MEGDWLTYTEAAAAKPSRGAGEASGLMLPLLTPAFFCLLVVLPAFLAELFKSPRAGAAGSYIAWLFALIDLRTGGAVNPAIAQCWTCSWTLELPQQAGGRMKGNERMSDNDKCISSSPRK